MVNQGVTVLYTYFIKNSQENCKHIIGNAIAMTMIHYVIRDYAD